MVTSATFSSVVFGSQIDPPAGQRASAEVSVCWMWVCCVLSDIREGTGVILVEYLHVLHM